MHKRTTEEARSIALRAEKIFNERKSALRFLDVFQKIQNFQHIFSTHHIVTQ